MQRMLRLSMLSLDYNWYEMGNRKSWVRVLDGNLEVWAGLTAVSYVRF